MMTAIASLWVSITSWITPTTLFLFINLVIGTIAVISSFSSNKRHRHQQDQHDSQRQLARSPSLLDRVKSIDFSLYTFQNHNQQHEQQSQFFQQHTEHGYDTNPVQTHQTQLDRAPSLLDRVKSINFSLYKFQNYNQQQEHNFFHGSTEPEFDTNPVEPEQPQLARAPSFLERVKSINFSYVNRSQQIYTETETEVTTKKVNSTVQESMKKSVSEKSIMVAKEEQEEEGDSVERRRPQTARLERTATIGDEDHGVDAKADDFINKFKRQLRLQRLDSLLRYKEMLRGR